MRGLVATLLLLILVGQAQSFPTGIDDRGDNGCVCHGGSDDTTTISITGLPDFYNSSEIYNFTLSIDSPVSESQNLNEARGGFRVIISHGEIFSYGWMIMEGGYTHNESINSQRSWQATWLAPSDDSKLATFIIHGNAVNGNGESSGDEWNSLAIAIPGANYTGEVITPILAEDNENYSSSDLFYIIGGLSIISLIVIIYLVSKD